MHALWQSLIGLFPLLSVVRLAFLVNQNDLLASVSYSRFIHLQAVGNLLRTYRFLFPALPKAIHVEHGQPYAWKDLRKKITLVSTTIGGWPLS